MYNRPVSAFANGLHDSMPMLVIRKCDQAKGFGVRVDLAVTSDGKSIIVCNQTTICDDFCCNCYQRKKYLRFGCVVRYRVMLY